MVSEDKRLPNKKGLNLITSFLFPEKSKVDITTFKGLIQDLLLRMYAVDVSGLGAQLAYFFLLSFFPLLIFLVALLPLLNLNQEHVFDFMQSVVPTEVFLLTQGTLVDILTSNNNGGILSISILGTVWSASRGVNALIKALNEAYDTKPKNSLIVRVWSIIFTIALVSILLLALTLPILGLRYGFQLFHYLGFEESFITIWTYVQWILPPFLIFIVLLLIYWIIPNTDPRLKIISVLPGAMFSTISWVALIYAFSYYINNFGNIFSTYGSIASVIVLMLWLYFTGMILIFGGLVNATFQSRRLAMKQKHRDKLTN
ncbi:YihY/virulence factor BrkB family protein [Ureibacillus manganicus]|uniref:Ribonuclease n=1 Tax=Ureibacillus manganicus DSM 26584 TaxID=1384049 RepID=A0A0A3IQB7_9BACL|nr:YihY/virulence factor BrkB family protein [Ureibacillus manganicus]KGR77027.1 ribonuclease [Ureibacillus manganicus DSM 26584]